MIQHSRALPGHPFSDSSAPQISRLQTSGLRRFLLTSSLQLSFGAKKSQTKHHSGLIALFSQDHTFVFSTIKDYSFLLFPQNVKFLNLFPNLDSMRCCLVSTLCLTLVIPWTVARQASLFIGFSRQEYRSGLLFPFPSPGDLPDPGIELASPAFQEICTAGIFFTTESPGKSITLIAYPNLSMNLKQDD